MRAYREIVESKNLKEILTRSTCLIPKECGITCHENDYCRCDIEYMKDKFFEVLGWMHAECCVLLDNGEDPRREDISEMIDRFKKDFGID